MKFGVKLSKRLVSAFSFCVVFLLLCELLYIKQDACRDEVAMLQIQILCSQYHNKEVVGNMCSALCDQSVFSFQRCHGNRRGKKVIIMSCDGCVELGKISTVVLKIEYDMNKWHRAVNTNLPALPSLEEKILSSTKEIRYRMKEYYDTELLDKKDLISFILGENYTNLFKSFSTPNAIDIVLKTAVALGSQEEFLSYKVLGSKPFLPKLYGVCGPAYFVENTPSFSALNYIYFVAKKPDVLQLGLVNGRSWRDRAKIALKILELVTIVEDNYETPLQICDVQPHNFGLSESGEVVMLDSDSLKFGQVVHSGSCKIDKDCAFKTCKGRCNQVTYTCEKEMVVNNLQVICRRLFVSELEIFGLLRFPPPAILEQLRKLLQQCMNPLPEVFKLPRENKSDRKILKQIEMLLESSL